MRAVAGLAVAGLFVGCASACSKGRSTADSPARSSTAVGLPTPSGAPPERIAPASYGDTFPRLDTVPTGLYGNFGPNELRLVVQPQPSALPLARRLAIEEPGLIVVVYEDSLDERTSAWLMESGLLRFEDQGDLRSALRELTSDPKLGNYLSKVTTPWPSMAVADGVAREFHEASLFHGPWLVWAGSTADARYPVKQAARGAWSRKALDDYESIRDHRLSPDGEWLVVMRMGAQEDLFVSHVDGSQSRRLTDDTHRDRGPAWSPDGGRIAFYSDRGGRYQLWLIRPDGSDLVQATALGSGTANFPVWSPDGKRVAFSVIPSGGHIVDVSGKRIARFKVPVDENGTRVWRDMKEVDTSSQGAHVNWPDRFFARIVDTWLRDTGNAGGRVGDADCHLIDARGLLDFALGVMREVAADSRAADRLLAP